jgi:hypothetical protein
MKCELCRHLPLFTKNFLVISVIHNSDFDSAVLPNPTTELRSKNISINNIFFLTKVIWNSFFFSGTISWALSSWLYAWTVPVRTHRLFFVRRN